jgi:hypothetical protein
MQAHPYFLFQFISYVGIQHKGASLVAFEFFKRGKELCCEKISEQRRGGAGDETA